MKDHLAGIYGNVAQCKELTSNIKREMIQQIRIKKRKTSCENNQRESARVITYPTSSLKYFRSLNEMSFFETYYSYRKWYLQEAMLENVPRTLNARC